MTVINKQLLADIGIILSDEEYASFSKEYEAELDARIVNEIVESLSPEQLIQLNHYKNGPEQELQRWLHENVPKLSEIVEQETSILLGDIAESSEGFNDNS
jgi:hypothetical protein